MKPLIARVKPTKGFARPLHISLLALVPVAVLVLVRGHFEPLALAMVVLSKWRMFAIHVRFWPAIVRANAVDLIIGFSAVLFISHTGNLWWQLVWTVAYGAWIVVLKRANSTPMIAIQAIVAQLVGLSALFVEWTDGPLYGLVPIAGLICYLAARHFFDSFEEPYAKLLAYLWGYFAAAVTWVLGHWLLFYGSLAQPTLLLSVLGYGLAGLYYLDHIGRLTTALKRQFIFIMIAVIVVMLTFSDWGDKIV